MYILFFFSRLCVKEGAREPAGEGVQTMCAGHTDEGHRECRQINEPVESNKVITVHYCTPLCTTACTTVGNYYCGDVNSVH